MRAIHEDEAFFRALAERAPAALFSIDRSGRIDFANRGTAELFGVRTVDLLGAGWRSLVHADDVEAIGHAVAAHRASGEAYAGDWRLRRSDGAYRWTQVCIVCTRDATGGIVRWFGTCVDIDVQRRAIDAFELLAASDATTATARDIDPCSNASRASRSMPSPTSRSSIWWSAAGARNAPSHASPACPPRSFRR